MWHQEAPTLSPGHWKSASPARHIVSKLYITRILHLYCICTASLLLWTGCSKNSILSSRCKLRDMCIWIFIGRCIFHLDLNLDLNVRMSMFLNLSTIWKIGIAHYIWEAWIQKNRNYFVRQWLFTSRPIWEHHILASQFCWIFMGALANKFYCRT